MPKLGPKSVTDIVNAKIFNIEAFISHAVFTAVALVLINASFVTNYWLKLALTLVATIELVFASVSFFKLNIHYDKIATMRWKSRFSIFASFLSKNEKKFVFLIKGVSIIVGVLIGKSLIGYDWKTTMGLLILTGVVTVATNKIFK